MGKLIIKKEVKRSLRIGGLKFNENHDENGRFAPSDGGGPGESSGAETIDGGGPGERAGGEVITRADINGSLKDIAKARDAFEAAHSRHSKNPSPAHHDAVDKARAAYNEATAAHERLMAAHERQNPEKAAEVVDVKAVAAELRCHDYVSTNSSSGAMKGRVVRVSRGGPLHVPNSLTVLTGSKADPAALVRIFADGAEGWKPTPHYLGVMFSQLTKIDPLIKPAEEVADPLEGKDPNDEAADGDGDEQKALVVSQSKAACEEKLEQSDAIEKEREAAGDNEFCQCEGECDCGKPKNPKPTAEVVENDPKTKTVVVTPSPKAMAELIGKAIFFASNGQRVAGKVARVDGGKLIVNLAVPGSDGILRVSDAEIVVKATDTEVVDALTKQTRMKAFEGGAHLTVQSKAIATVMSENGESICDYQNVVIDGFASTFQSTTPKDRSGDYILPKAFNRTIPEFMKNPVILTDHVNQVQSIAGSWTKVSTNLRGLTVIGSISNAPGIRDTRFKLVEGHLKGVSIGGIWYYIEDGNGIEDADLFEISLVAIPMNPDALIQTRSLGEADCVKAFSKYWRSHTGLRDS